MSTRRAAPAPTRGGRAGQQQAASSSLRPPSGAPSRPTARSTSASSVPTRVPSPNIPPAFDPTPSSQPEASSSQPSSSSSLQERRVQPRDNSTNIKVVVRCRGRIRSEIQQRTPVIISTNDGRHVNVAIASSSQGVKEQGVSKPAPVKSYEFDNVFDADATQLVVYHKVVQPAIQEMLNGYNCTILAYGQTGTGKTYTMQGNPHLTPDGRLPDDAGMIPRALASLFQRLEEQSSEYSVKVSYMEIYNEELRDLLAPDAEYSPDFTSTELRIYEDQPKKGDAKGDVKTVKVHGLHEFGAADKKEAMKWFAKGSQRRQIAATTMNDQSSRSHSIFTVIVDMNRKDSKDEHRMRTAKLNLVDLAGSENIGRSGAENQRAREAGKINQSLLTLGRVINALVENAQHVPHRQSNLTRLLKDSLGGSTKTCIIATISPVESNREETISTLDYALSAKSIKNKPMVNELITKNGRIHEYVMEIDRLKLDLIATRQQKGRFFDEDGWRAIELEHERIERDSKKNEQDLERVRIQLKAAEDDLRAKARELKKNEEIRDDALEKLKVQTDRLEQTSNELHVTQVKLEEESVVSSARERSEKNLDAIAADLQTIAAQSINDNGGLFDKLDRKTSVLTTNSTAVKSHSKSLNVDASTLNVRLDDFYRDLNQLSTQLGQKADRFQSVQSQTLSEQANVITDQLNRVEAAVHDIASKESLDANIASVFARVIRENNDRIRAGFQDWSVSLQQESRDCISEIAGGLARQVSNVNGAFQDIFSILEQVIQEDQEHIESERQAALALQTMTENATALEIRRLKEQIDTLVQHLEAERQASDTERSEFISKVSDMMSGYNDIRNARLRETIESVTQELDASEQTIETLKDDHSRSVKAMVSTQQEALGQLEHALADADHSRNLVSQTLEELSGGMRDDLESLQEIVAKQVQARSSEVSSVCQEVDMASRTFSHMEENRNARAQALDTLRSGTAQALEDARSMLLTTSGDMQNTMSDIATDANTMGSSLQTYRSSAANHISKILSTTRSLSQEATLDDVSTGSTPRKRKWDLVDSWPATKPREELLNDWRSRGTANDTDDTEDQPAVASIRTTVLRHPLIRRTVSTSTVQPPSNVQEVEHVEEELDEEAVPALSASPSRPRTRSTFPSHHVESYVDYEIPLALDSYEDEQPETQNAVSPLSEPQWPNTPRSSRSKARALNSPGKTPLPPAFAPSPRMARTPPLHTDTINSTTAVTPPSSESMAIPSTITRRSHARSNSRGRNTASGALPAPLILSSATTMPRSNTTTSTRASTAATSQAPPSRLLKRGASNTNLPMKKRPKTG